MISYNAQQNNHKLAEFVHPCEFGMDTGVQPTSFAAFEKIKGTIGPRQALVYATILDNPGMNNRQLAELIFKPINTITPRVNELRKKRLVVFAGEKYDSKTDRMAMTWRVQ